jgi:hypothetical protein
MQQGFSAPVELQHFKTGPPHLQILQDPLNDFTAQKSTSKVHIATIADLIPKERVFITAFKIGRTVC